MLLVEDNPAVRDALAQGLTQRGHTVTAVPDGDDIESMLSGQAVDILLLDVGLGEGHCDGFTLARIARRLSDCGIVMITARGEREDRIQGLQDGADAYLVKPVDFDELSAVIRSVARRMQRMEPRG